MKELGIYEDYEKLEGQKIYGITFSSPNGTVISIDAEKDRKNPAPGYVRKRLVLDNFLFKEAKKKATEFRVLHVKDLIIEDDFVRGIIGTDKHGKTEEHRARIVLGADGATSVVAMKFGLNKNPPNHLIVALRGYYKNVDGMTDRLEIHLIKEIIPGYFWIFPLPNKEANVGIGMIAEDMNKKGVNLKEAMLKQIKENPLFVERFRNAKLVGEIKGWNLPIASYHRKNYGNGFLLLGDAASLIDPLSGEGIGQAMISGKIAAEVALEAMEEENFSEKFLKRYDKKLWDIIGQEIKNDYRVLKIGKRFPHLIDRLMMKATKDEKFRQRFEKLIPYAGGRGEIGSDDFIKELEKD